MAASPDSVVELPIGPKQRAASERLGEEVASHLRAAFHGMEPEEREEIRRILQESGRQHKAKEERVITQASRPVEGILPEDRAYSIAFKTGASSGYIDALRDICSLTYVQAK